VKPGATGSLLTSRPKRLFGGNVSVVKAAATVAEEIEADRRQPLPEAPSERCSPYQRAKDKKWVAPEGCFGRTSGIS